MVGWENYKQIDGCNKLKGKGRQRERQRIVGRRRSIEGQREQEI